MDYGSIIKRAWQITWKYKVLWVLGIFAGISGCQGGGSGSGSRGGDIPGHGGQPSLEFRQLLDSLQQWLPLLIAGGLLLVLISIVWMVFAIAARGGLIVGVNRIEGGQAPALGELWSAGFSRFWALLGVEVLLRLPIFLVTVGMLVGIFVPLLGPFMGGREPGAEVIAPICGSVAIGVPLLIVLWFILGIMELIAKRYLMLGDQRVLQATGNSWRFFRARLKDTFLMWLISGALNLAASIVLFIPLVIIGVVVALPAFFAIAHESWEGLVPIVAVGAILFMLISLAYAGIWGTFTSALWTIFFRKVSGLEPPVTREVVAYPDAAPLAPPPPPIAPTPDPMPAPQAPEFPPYPPKPPAPGV